MAFWNNSAIEPKRKFRWVLILPITSADPNAPAIQTYTVRSVSKPKFTLQFLQRVGADGTPVDPTWIDLQGNFQKTYCLFCEV